MLSEQQGLFAPIPFLLAAQQEIFTISKALNCHKLTYLTEFT